MILISWAQFKSIIDSGVPYSSVLDPSGNTLVYAEDGNIVYQSIPTDSDLTDFQNNYQSGAYIGAKTSQSAFASKILPNGKKLYSRAIGKSFTLSTGANTLDFDVPYPACKITGIEIIGGEVGDTLDFFILDDDLGTYSTVPNYTLNQFGYDVAMAKDFYKRESTYDADLYYNMCISIAYYSQSAKTVYINYVLHEVKD